MMNYLNYIKNRQRILSRCKQIVLNCEKEIPQISSSSWGDLENYLKPLLKSCACEISEWENCNNDYIDISYKLLSSATYDLLTSGRYHLARGYLSPMGCAKNLQYIHKKVLLYAVDNNLITESEMDEDLFSLKEDIYKI